MTARVGMLAPITHRYPPSGYGPWERVTHDLTESLIEAGHAVVLFAPVGSVTSAKLDATAPAPLSERPDLDWRRLEDEHISTALSRAEDLDLDVVHSHLHVHALARAELFDGPLLSTLHGVAWAKEMRPALRRFAKHPFVSLSDSERDFLPDLNYVATIPNGIRTEDFPPGDGSGGYLTFVGRLAPEKAPHLAIEVARRVGLPLLIAGTVEARHRQYAESVLAKLGRGIDYLGALQRPELAMLLANASGLIMPLQWDEPFGLVVVESLSCGTPVVAWNRGAMTEIVEHEKTGFLVGDVADAVDACRRLGQISREECRHAARHRFDSQVMAHAYARVYDELAFSTSRRSRPRVTSPRS